MRPPINSSTYSCWQLRKLVERPLFLARGAHKRSDEERVAVRLLNDEIARLVVNRHFITMRETLDYRARVFVAQAFKAQRARNVSCRFARYA